MLGQAFGQTDERQHHRPVQRLGNHRGVGDVKAGDASLQIFVHHVTDTGGGTGMCAAYRADHDGVGATASLDEDLFMIDVDGQPQTLLGLLEATEENTIIFSFEGETRELPIDRIQYVGMASAGLIQPDFGSLVSLTDNSRIFGRPIRWDKETLRLDLAGLSELDLPGTMIKSIQNQNDRMGFLSDIEPQTANITGLLLPARPWRRDLTVEGRPLTLQGTGARSKIQTFEKGLGIPSDGRLTFPAASYDRFLSTACLDPAKRGAGDCEIEILLDGKSVFLQRLNRDSPAAEIDVELGNASQIMLHVKAGEKLDLADHVNWCDARLVKVRTP